MGDEDPGWRVPLDLVQQQLLPQMPLRTVCQPLGKPQIPLAQGTLAVAAVVVVVEGQI